MKNLPIALLLACLFLSTQSFAQNANIGSKTCAIQKVNLPLNYTEPDNRYYSLVTKGSFSYGLDKENNRLYGWGLDEVNPNLKAVVSLYGFSLKSPQKHSKKVENKDKDGKVTSSYTEYWYDGEAVGNGTLYLYGDQNEFVYTRKKAKDKGPTKAELRRQELAAAAKKKTDDNPFLSDKVKDELATSEIEEDSGLENSALPLVKSIRVNQSKSLSTGKHKSASAAYREYREKIYPQLADFRAAYPQLAYQSAIRTLNAQYGFAPTRNIFRVRTMKNKKHAEASLWNNATDATIQIFKLARFNQPIAEQQEAMLPVVDYFVTQLERNSEDDKKQRKVKKAALENLMNIYYYLDQHDKVLDLTAKFTESKKLSKVAKRMSSKSTRQLAHLAHLNMKTCHLNDDTIEFVESDVIEVEEEVTEGN